MLPAPINVLGVRINPIVRSDLLECLELWGLDSEQRTILYANVHGVNLAQSLPDFRDILNSADLLFCDGVGLRLGARLLGDSLPERMSHPDWIDDFGIRAASRKLRVFALGDEPGVASAFLNMFCERHPGVVGAGSHHGFFDRSGPTNDSIVESINASGAHVLMVGLGMPTQERWIRDNAHKLSPRLLVTVGAMYRWYTGVDRRAPRWVTDNGLEWLSRLARNPRKLFRRYAIGNPLFVVRVLRSKFRS